MKKTIAAALAVLFLLSACSGRSAESSSPAESVPEISESSEFLSEVSDESKDESISEIASESVPESSSEVISETAAENISESDADASQSSDTENAPVSASVDDWRLVLVNPWHKLEQEMDIDLVLPPSATNPNRHMVDRRIVDDLEDMIASAKADGVSLLIDYGYRTFAQSEALFEKQINSQLAANPSYTREQAEEAAKAWVAPPGTSDHHTGLALDIVTPEYQMLNDGFADTPAGQWMAAHSWEYGFVIRFPADKTDITGITYESWHLRYVGRDNAQVMHENNLCLEEYVEMLAAEQ